MKAPKKIAPVAISRPIGWLKNNKTIPVKAILNSTITDIITNLAEIIEILHSNEHESWVPQYIIKPIHKSRVAKIACESTYYSQSFWQEI